MEKEGLAAGLQAARIAEGDMVTAAVYLSRNPHVTHYKLGEFLGQNKPLMEAYVTLFPVKDLSYMTALRSFLSSFRPVPEALIIDRYVDTWIQHYMTHSKHADRAHLISHDDAFMLTYSVIMLNIELHSPGLANHPKMSLEQYQRNLADIVTVPASFVESIYTDIVQDEIQVKPRSS